MGSLPLAVRLAALATLILGIALLAGGLAFRNALRTQQRNEISEAARQRVSTLVQTVESGTIPTRLPSARDSPLFAQVVNPAGKVVGSTTNVDDMLVMVNLKSWNPTTTLTSGTGEVDKAKCLVFVRGVKTATGQYTVIVASPLRASEQTMQTLMNQLVAITPAVVALSALLFWLLARRALRPVETLRSEVDSVSATELHRRVSAPAANDEVGRLARTMNSLLGRLEESSVRQTRFVSDASHELRSPLAGIRTKMEVALRNPDRTDWPALARSVLNDSSRMERLTTNLLFLAKSANAPVVPFADVDLDDLVLEEVATLRMRSSIAFSTTGVSGGRVYGDADQLRRVVINLLDNAARYAQSSVACVVKMTETGVQLDIADDGPGIPVDQRDRIFERFARVDEDRSRERGGAGLGLAIVADILRTHMASVAVIAAEPHGAIMRVRFPSPPADRSATTGQ
jgi:signal transduction histidine kinase